jgi:hypothetical protein
VQRSKRQDVRRPCLVNEGAYEGLKPDYLLGTGEVFLHATKTILSSNRRTLDVLCSPGHGTNEKGFPLWACDFVNFGAILISDVSFSRLQSNSRIYNCSSGTILSLAFPRHNQLELVGVALDIVGLIGRPGGDQWNLSTELVRERMKLFFGSQEFSELEENAQIEAFWRTMLAGQIGESKEGNLKPHKYEPKDLKISGDLFAFIQGFSNRVLADAAIQSAILTAIAGRSFFLAWDGLPGHCNPNVEPGDEIWAIHSSPVPLDIRRVEDQQGTEGEQFYIFGEIVMSTVLWMVLLLIKRDTRNRRSFWYEGVDKKFLSTMLVAMDGDF